MLFPKNPTSGQIFKPIGEKVKYKWNSYAWEKVLEKKEVETEDRLIRKLSRDINKEVPVELADGYNFIFSLSFKPILGSEQLYVNGLLQKRGSSYDYVIIDNKIYFNEPPFEGSTVICTYSTLNRIEIKNEVPLGEKDDINRFFYLLNIPEDGTEHIFLNGLLQKSGKEYDYILNENTIIFNNPPVKNSIICANYTTFE
jgi:hypothetical protein